MESKQRQRLLAGCSVVALSGMLWWVWNHLPPPQIGTDPEAFQAVDALFTALTSRDSGRLQDCERRLHAIRDAGRLSARPARFLDGVIDQARAGQWEPAARRLFDFMSGQHAG